MESEKIVKFGLSNDLRVRCFWTAFTDFVLPPDLLCTGACFSSKTAVFFIRRSARSCCQTAYSWTSRLLCRRRSQTERPTGRCRFISVCYGCE